MRKTKILALQESFQKSDIPETASKRTPPVNPKDSKYNIISMKNRNRRRMGSSYVAPSRNGP